MPRGVVLALCLGANTRHRLLGSGDREIRKAVFTVLRGRFGFQWVLIAIMLVDGPTTGNGEAQVSVSFFACPQQKAHAKGRCARSIQKALLSAWCYHTSLRLSQTLPRQQSMCSL